MKSFQPVFFCRKNHRAALPAKTKRIPVELVIKAFCIFTLQSFYDA